MVFEDTFVGTMGEQRPERWIEVVVEGFLGVEGAAAINARKGWGTALDGQPLYNSIIGSTCGLFICTHILHSHDDTFQQQYDDECIN